MLCWCLYLPLSRHGLYQLHPRRRYTGLRTVHDGLISVGLGRAESSFHSSETRPVPPSLHLYLACRKHRLRAGHEYAVVGVPLPCQCYVPIPFGDTGWGEVLDADVHPHALVCVDGDGRRWPWLMLLSRIALAYVRRVLHYAICRGPDYYAILSMRCSI